MRQRLGYVPALDGLRGVAILAVVATHYYGLPGGGPTGVGLFFVLSGFLITTLLIEEHEVSHSIRFRAFYSRRARRLFPALTLLLSVYLLVEAVRGRDGGPTVALGGLYFGNIVQAFSLHDVVSGTPLGHLWSLAQEEQFYLVWPCIIVLVLRTRRALLWLSILLVGLVGYRIGLLLNGSSVTRLYYAPDTHSDWLAAGALLAVVRRRGISVSEPIALVGFVSLIAGLILNPWTRQWELWQGTLILLGCVCLVAAAFSETQLAQLLSIRPLVDLGKISYSLYLWHIPVFAALGYRHPYIAVPLSIFAAWLSYRFVEQPVRRRRVRPQGEREPLVGQLAARFSEAPPRTGLSYRPD